MTSPTVLCATTLVTSRTGALEMTSDARLERPLRPKLEQRRLDQPDRHSTMRHVAKIAYGQLA